MFMTKTTSAVSRRRVLTTALASAIAPNIIPGRARAQQKTLKILEWKHFVPSYNHWFNDTYAKEWGDKNDTQVIVDYVGMSDLNSRALAEVRAQQGHDLVIFITPPSIYEDQAIDHREIYEECERKYGKAADYATRSTYNPKTGKHYGFCAYYLPAVISYRKDLWDAVRSAPDSWDQVRTGGRRIKLLHGRPVGFSLAPEDNSEHTMRTIMYCFGSSEQDEAGNPALRSRETLEVLRYVKALYEEAMTKDVLAWDAASNNRFMLTGEGCLTLDTMSIPRASESMKLPFATDLRLAKVPEGPAGRRGPSFGFRNYVIWRFASNIEGAKRFLVDYVANARRGMTASGFQNLPTFPGAVPDLAPVVANDPRANPSDKYSLLADASTWTSNIGYPGYTNAAVGEIFTRGLIPTMCARAATGELTPEDALDRTDKEVREIFQTWKDRGKL
jgi:multiple sugar transport system substrate-binding protein